MKLNNNVFTNRNGKWNYESHNKECRVCGSTVGQEFMGKEYYTKSGQDLILCTNCSHLYLYPDLEKDSLIKFYKEDYRKIYTMESAKNYDTEYFKKWMFQKYAERRLEILDRYMSKNSRVFELGSGFGGFLACAYKQRPDLHLYANELDENNRMRLISGEFVQFIELDHLQKIPSFDLIVSFHVFEHLIDPLDVLLNLKRSLSKEGRLVVEVPDAGTDWKNWMYIHTAHLSYFTEQSLKALAYRAGLGVEYVGAHPGGNAFAGTLWAVFIHGERELGVMKKNYISDVRSHVAKYKLNNKTKIKNIIKILITKLFGAELVGYIQRNRYYNKNKNII